ncbi:DUF4129 domain-containing protein [Promicromonospora iranensis]|uniref:Protein-glutamine gamma-glutamyltransferase-like C-terminal domain-containing protein n=1 Tax=Promicromonospora iranensis TaxID=1105144 RepID=A0ABU2CGX9_9MICO|nr:DUF4129 domain-containing protein [Promicromonospora iranensis]MDR7380572.1 hypothetical protein [Promicromonospora iranensis]
MRPAIRLTVTALLVTVVVLGAATATPWRFSPPHLPTPELSLPDQSPPSPDTSRRPMDQPLDTGTENPWIGLVIAVLLALLVIALVTAVARKLLALRRQRIDTTPDNLTAGTATGSLGDAVDLPELQDAVSRALAHLDGHARPRDAVVAAWVALEEAAERAGAHRDPAQTPTEFAGTVLAATPAPPAAVTRLRTLYQRARFTDRPIDRPAVAQAREALADIARSLDIDKPSPDAESDLPQGPEAGTGRGPA